MRKQLNLWQSQDVETWTFKERDEDKKAKREQNVERNVERGARKIIKRDKKECVGKNFITVYCITRKGNGAIPI